MAIVFFGIGAMRAGTTWLTEILQSHPDCSIPATKELHFFDVRYGVKGVGAFRHLGWQLENNSRNVASWINELKQPNRPWTSGRNSDRSLQDDPLASENALEPSETIRTLEKPTGHQAFRALHTGRIRKAIRTISAIAETLSIDSLDSYIAFLQRQGGNASAFGEVTPAYALLPTAAYAEMNSAFPGARFIFIMRDPVDRLWSQVRYDEGKAARNNGNCRDANVAFGEALRHPEMTARSNYERTIQALERAVSTRQIVYLFYEKLVSAESGPEEIRRIESILGLLPVDVPPESFHQRTNASPPGTITRENESDAMKKLAPVYKFVRDRFGTVPGWRIPA